MQLGSRSMLKEGLAELSEQMDMRDEWLAALRAWAASNDSVLEMWLFGSRAKKCARKHSDIDVALRLMPPDGNHNWALGNFIFLFDDWKAELRQAVDWPISLVAIGPTTGPKFEMDDEVLGTGILLWRRPAPPALGPPNNERKKMVAPSR
jgi:predicted nucleotidyltransferase